MCYLKLANILVGQKMQVSGCSIQMLSKYYHQFFHQFFTYYTRVWLAKLDLYPSIFLAFARPVWAIHHNGGEKNFSEIEWSVTRL